MIDQESTAGPPQCEVGEWVVGLLLREGTQILMAWANEKNQCAIWDADVFWESDNKAASVTSMCVEDMSVSLLGQQHLQCCVAVSLRQIFHLSVVEGGQTFHPAEEFIKIQQVNNPKFPGRSQD